MDKFVFTSRPVANPRTPEQLAMMRARGSVKAISEIRVSKLHVLGKGFAEGKRLVVKTQDGEVLLVKVRSGALRVMGGWENAAKYDEA